MPRFVVLHSKFANKNVSYAKDGGPVHPSLQISGEDVGSPYSKFELEASKSTGNGGLVNIRCCYNNKYWALNERNFWLAARVDVPDEDVTKRSCTLFEPVYVDVAKTTVQFLHVQTRNFAYFRGTGNTLDSCLCAGPPIFNTQNEFEVIDWETLVIFPKHVAFKGDNGNYLRGIGGEGHEYLEYETTDIGSTGVGFEIFPTPNGSVRIKSNFNGKFWRRMGPNPHSIVIPNGIYANSTDTSTNNPDTLVLPIKVSDNVVALRNMGNNQFCKRLTAEGKTSCLNASDPTISEFARMEVEESVLSRTIYNVVYRLTDSRIYNENILTMANGFATNSTREPNTITIKLTYTESWSKIWNASVSLSLGIKSSMQMGVPLIASVGVEICMGRKSRNDTGIGDGVHRYSATND